MSQENVEIVRESLAAYTDGGIDAAAEFWDADYDVTNVPEEVLDLDISYAVAYTLRDGKIVCGREYIDRNEALEAVGLRE